MTQVKYEVTHESCRMPQMADVVTNDCGEGYECIEVEGFKHEVKVLKVKGECGQCCNVVKLLGFKGIDLVAKCDEERIDIPLDHASVREFEREYLEESFIGAPNADEGTL